MCIKMIYLMTVNYINWCGDSCVISSGLRMALIAVAALWILEDVF